jgi:hypothetical protein
VYSGDWRPTSLAGGMLVLYVLTMVTRLRVVDRRLPLIAGLARFCAVVVEPRRSLAPP